MGCSCAEATSWHHLFKCAFLRRAARSQTAPLAEEEAAEAAAAVVVVVLVVVLLVLVVEGGREQEEGVSGQDGTNVLMLIEIAVRKKGKGDMKRT